MIDKMTPEEKSVVLARLCGWDIRYIPPELNKDYGFVHLCSGTDVIWFQKFKYPSVYPTGPDLYAPENMALASKVMQWAETNLMQGMSDEAIWRYGYTFAFHSVALALDGVLKLAYEEGMVNDEN